MLNKTILKQALLLFFSPIFFVVGVLFAIVAQLKNLKNYKARLVWGSTPLINNRHWSKAMSIAGFESETFTYPFYGSINQRSDWGRLLDESWSWCPTLVRPFFAFLEALIKYDVFFISADGFFIGTLPFIWRFQFPLFRLAGKKVVFLPYGGDSYVYRRIRSTPLLHGLLLSYPKSSRRQLSVQARLDYWCKHSDACIPGVTGMDGFGRWDVILASALSLDLSEWKASDRKSPANGRNGTVFICHAPNHQGFKGTEFIVDAVQQLKSEKLQVELILLEKIQNSQVQQVMQSKVDILVEQLIVTGHGLNGLEGLASGLPVVSNLEDDSYILPMRRWSYFSECPIVSASPESLVDVLRKLVTNPELRIQLGSAGRKYAEKYHGLDSAAYLFNEVIEYVYGRRDSLMNLYHPLLGIYPRRLPLIEHPLVNNRIVGE